MGVKIFCQAPVRKLFCKPNHINHLLPINFGVLFRWNWYPEYSGKISEKARVSAQNSVNIYLTH
jgi:hypothetical protein